LRINAAARRVWCDGDRLGLTPSEFHALLTMARSPGEVQSTDRLRGPGARTADSAKAAKVTIATLRRKLGERRGMIRTTRGSGYCLDPQGSDDGPPRCPT
jgi:DNA-binding response OmpR family regulator